MSWFNRLKLFLEDVWTEIRPKDGKVTWPTRNEVWESTWVVIVCVCVFSVYLAVLDGVFRKTIEMLVQ